jgi:hypothetical protein
MPSPFSRFERSNARLQRVCPSAAPAARIVQLGTSMSQANEGAAKERSPRTTVEAEPVAGAAIDGAGAGEPASNERPSGEEEVREQLRELVRRQPWVSLAAAAAAGGVLGGIGFSRLGRLTFAAAAGFVAHELWHREGRLAVDDVLARFARGDRDDQDAAAPARAKGARRR